jgi:hypothetical protein
LKEVFKIAVNNAQNRQNWEIKQSHSYSGVDSEAGCQVMCNVSWIKSKIIY